MKTYLMRGVPASLKMDAWWMSANTQTTKPPVFRMAGNLTAKRRKYFMLAILLAFILLADWLFWGHEAGLSLVVFALALVFGMLTTMEHQLTRRDGVMGGAILVIGLLPVLSYVQTISLLLYGATLIWFAAWVSLAGQGKTADMLRAVMRFVMLAPMQATRDVMPSLTDSIRDHDLRGMLRALLQAWALPVLVGTVFLALFVAGNPVFEILAYNLPSISADVDRIAFWVLIGVLIWPFLVLRTMRQRMQLPFSLPYLPKTSTPTILNVKSVMNSLVLFNLMFAMQTGLDMVYLWGNAALPEGLTLATYAHRGAYPLVATALLAGIFALISRSYVQNRRGMRGLLLLWLLQNIALVAGSVMRLDLYVEAFGLTYLRVAAFIWMGMVAAGLVLIAWQLLRDKSNGWLLVRVSALLVLVLYVCSFVNFANLIATNNLGRSKQVEVLTRTGSGYVRTDAAYICSLGPMALPAIVAFERETGQIVCEYGTAPQPPEINDWREWGFRKWQVQRYLATELGPKDML